MTLPNRTAFEQGLIASIPNLRAFATSLSRNAATADDLVQDTLVKAWNNAASFEEGSNLRAWLFTILRNTYFSDLRRRSREVEDVDGAMADKLTVLPSQNSHMDLIDFRHAFDELSDDQKEVLVLVGAEGFSYEEAAVICGCAVGTVKSRVNRARGALAKKLGIYEAALEDAEAEANMPPRSSERAVARTP